MSAIVRATRCDCSCGLREHALDLAADALGDRAVQRSSRPGAGCSSADRGLAELEVLELVERLVELVEQERGRRRAIARQPREVPVERRLRDRAGTRPSRRRCSTRSRSVASSRSRSGGLWSGEDAGCCSSATPPNVPWRHVLGRAQPRAIARASVARSGERPPSRPAAPTPTCAPRSKPTWRARPHSSAATARNTSTGSASQADRFALRTAAPDDIRAAVALLEEQTNVQALAPVDSRNRGVSAAKKVVRKAVFFAVNHLTEQMRALGWAATSVGEAAAERIEQLEARVHALEAPGAALDGDRPRTRRIVTEVHQFLSTFAGRDAIGMHTLRLRTLLRDAGFESDIYAVDTHDDVAAIEALDPMTFAPRPARADDAWILYHFSIGSPLFDHVREFDVPLALDYHNITDAKYFWRWEPRAGDDDARRPAPARGRRAGGPVRARRLRVQRGASSSRSAARAPRSRRSCSTSPTTTRRPTPTLVRPPATRTRRGRHRLARGRAHRARTSASTTSCSRSRCTAACTTRARASRSSAVRAPASTGVRCTASPPTSASPTP